MCMIQKKLYHLMKKIKNQKNKMPKINYNKIVVKNNTNIPLEVTMITTQTKYKKQLPKGIIDINEKKEIIIFDDFSKLLISKKLIK